MEEEEKEKEEQKTGEEQKESAETVEEAKAEVEEETEEVSEKEEIPEKEEEVVEGEVVEGEEIPAPSEGEEAKPPPREEKVEEEEIVEERIYTVPLGKCWIVPPNKRAPRAMRMIRSFVVKHMKLEQRKAEGEEEEEAKRLIISNDVNEMVWGRGIEKPPRKIRIRAAKDKEGNVTVYLAEGD